MLKLKDFEGDFVSDSTINCIFRVNEAFTNILIQMARFRNRLVHIYWEVDDNELYRIVQTRLQDIREFLKEIGAFIGARV